MAGRKGSALDNSCVTMSYLIIVLQGSLTEMTRPMQGVSMISSVQIEFHTRIKKGEQEENDLLLIDGATDYCNLTMPTHHS